MYCHECGLKQPDVAFYCYKCGTRLTVARIEETKRAVNGHDDGNNTVAVMTNAPEIMAVQSDVQGTKKEADHFYVLPPGKFIALSFLTFGLYEIFWFAKNWTVIRDQERSKIHPILRALFSIFFFSELAARALRVARSKGYEKTYSYIWLTIAFIALNFTYSIPRPASIIGLTSALPLLPVLNAMMFANGQKKGAKINKQFSTGEIVVAIIGAIVWLGVVANFVEYLSE